MPVARRMNRRSSAGPSAILNDPEPTCVEDVAALSEDALNAYWPQVTRIMEGNIHREANDDESTATPKATGQQMIDHTAGSEFRPLDWPTVKALSPQQYLDRKTEVDSFIARGGKAA